jgi:hypothetical protein
MLEVERRNFRRTEKLKRNMIDLIIERLILNVKICLIDILLIVWPFMNILSPQLVCAEGQKLAGQGRGMIDYLEYR